MCLHRRRDVVMFSRSSLCLLLAASLLLAACAPPAVKPTGIARPPASAAPPAPTPASVSAPAPAPPTSAAPKPTADATPRYERAAWSALDGWTSDDHAAAWRAFIAGCGTLKARADWKQVCELALQTPRRDARAARQFFEAQFEPWRVAYDDEKGLRSETGLITGYYEPQLRGARKPGGAYTTPLYGVPDDLLTVDFGDVYPQLRGERLRGRLQGRRVLPYYERATLAANAALRGKELVWVDDAVDAFFLQVQGSGRVQLPNGEVLRLAYADQNGQPYKAIGRYLVQQGELTVEQATAPGLRQWLATHPQRLQEVLNANPSVVFFKEEKLADPSVGPKGALGVPLTAGRSIAVDPRNLPLGAPLFLATTEPGTTQPLTRLVMAQDTGGAIRGVVRADLFWGLGPEAGDRAGNMRQQGRLWLLWPRERRLPPPGPGVAPPAPTSSAELQAVLAQVTQATGRQFLVDRQVPAQLRLGTVDVASIDYPLLLAILRNNALAAVTLQGVVNIVPDANIRSYALPTVLEDDPAMADDEWVTRLVKLNQLDPGRAVSALRPLLPQQGELAAVPGSNTLILVDRYGNSRRLIELLRTLDPPAAK
jgi:membrane-bound lytic murein transglycosylase A